MSNPTFDAAFAAGLAELERVVPVQSEPFGYGRDLSCVLDATGALDEVDPNSVRAIGEACLRRLITPRGSLPGNRDYGLDLRGYLNRGTTFAEIRDLSSRVRTELKQDDRVVEAIATIVMPNPASMSVSITITPADSKLDSFDLTFDVSNVGVANVEIV